MRVRYTATASRELDEAIGFLREFAPSIAARFADEIDKAIAELVEYPYSAQQTAMEQVRRKYVRRFRYSIFYSVAVILAGYLPIYALSGASGKLFLPMAETMSYALVGSLIFTLTLVPVLASYWFTRIAWLVLKPCAAAPKSVMLKL